MWHWLPPELRRLVLQYLSLPQLRLLKTVSRSMATDCRAVLRSRAWQIRGANYYAMEEELKTQLHTYRLPLLVSCFAKFFPRNAPCLATIHRLRLNRINSYGDALNADDVATWDAKHNDNSDVSTIVSDMCIEVHGHGICGSMTTLRQVLQDVVRARGVKGAASNRMGQEWTTEALQEGLWKYEVTELGEDEGGWSVGPRLCVPSPSGKHLNSPDEVPTVMVLQEMEIVTFTRKGFFMDNECPSSMEEGRDYYGNMDPLYMCQMGAKLFVR
tara:strand:+ start:855 stop:1667 length:813 start_codon:yes stop_codon:yes gene_type:complete